MADKKLIDNASATTVDNFYGNKGGADVQIPLATAASVLAGQMAFYKKGFLLAVGETKTLDFAVNNTYAIIISVAGRMGSANALYFASGYGVSRARNSIFKLVGGIELTIDFDENLCGFKITNNIETDVRISVFFMEGSTYTLS